MPLKFKLPNIFQGEALQFKRFYADYLLVMYKKNIFWTDKFLDDLHRPTNYLKLFVTSKKHECVVLILKLNDIIFPFNSYSQIMIHKKLFQPSLNVNHSHPYTIWQNLRHPLAVKEVVSWIKMLPWHSPSTKQTGAESNKVFHQFTNIHFFVWTLYLPQ